MKRVRLNIQTFATVVALAVSLPFALHAADLDNGRKLALSDCSVCHEAMPYQRHEHAKAPPFEVIARAYDYNPAALVLAIFGPHPRMNFVPQPPHAENIAAYIATLPR